jgi:hypothetical protein
MGYLLEIYKEDLSRELFKNNECSPIPEIVLNEALREPEIVEKLLLILKNKMKLYLRKNKKYKEKISPTSPHFKQKGIRNTR